MQHDDQVYLKHMLEMSRKARSLVADRAAADFEADETL